MQSFHPRSSELWQVSPRLVLGKLLILTPGFFAVGCLLIAAGAIVKTNYQDSVFNLNSTSINPQDAQDLKNLAQLAPVVLIVCGCFVSLVSLLGCIGSCFEKRFLLIM
jgi:hypothetical protein